MNAGPHIGHAMDYLLADIYRRYLELHDIEYRFQAGTDEHGNKIFKKALSHGVSPQAFVDQNTQIFQDFVQKLGVQYTDFIRTTDKKHIKNVQIIWTKLQNHIYASNYDGWYCEGCESYVTNKEYEENHQKGVSTFRAEEKYRIMFEGIACWPWLRVTSEGLKSRGINMVATIYADAFGLIYEDFDGMCRAYAKVPNCMNLELARDKRIKLCKDNSVEGILVHTNRSCKLWSGFMPEMSRQIGESCGIPVASFDGDQADPRNFSEAQYDTRVQGLAEIMEMNKEGL